MGFGALAISQVLPDITWPVVGYAILSLTVVRMLPVAIAMTRSGARWQTLAFMGWFGPRGLASVVFGLLALERGVPDSRTLLTTVVVTVALSVFLHGLTAKPFIAIYSRWYRNQTQVAPSAAEAAPTPLPRGRHQPGPTDAQAGVRPGRPWQLKNAGVQPAGFAIEAWRLGPGSADGGWRARMLVVLDELELTKLVRSRSGDGLQEPALWLCGHLPAQHCDRIQGGEGVGGHRFELPLDLLRHRRVRPSRHSACVQGAMTTPCSTGRVAG